MVARCCHEHGLREAIGPPQSDPAQVIETEPIDHNVRPVEESQAPDVEQNLAGRIALNSSIDDFGFGTTVVENAFELLGHRLISRYASAENRGSSEDHDPPCPRLPAAGVIPSELV